MSRYTPRAGCLKCGRKRDPGHMLCDRCREWVRTGVRPAPKKRALPLQRRAPDVFDKPVVPPMRRCQSCRFLDVWRRTDGKQPWMQCQNMASTRYRQFVFCRDGCPSHDPARRVAA